MASRLIFLHHLQSLNRRGRLWISWKADGCAYPGYRGARRGALKGTGDSGLPEEQLIPGDKKSRPVRLQVPVPQTDTGR